MRGGDCQRHAHPERVKIGRRLVGVQALGLVEGQNHGLAGAQQFARYELILRGESGARVGQHDDAVSLGDSLFGLHAHLRLDAARIINQATGVDQHAGHGTDARVTVLAVPGHSRNIGDNGVARARQRIEQRRLADIGPPDDGDDGKHRRSAELTGAPAARWRARAASSVHLSVRARSAADPRRRSSDC